MPGGRHSKHGRSRGPAVKIIDLPVDIIRRIFAKLDSTAELCKLMEVCTIFSKAAKGPALWKEVKVVDPLTHRAGNQDSQETKVIDPITHRAGDQISTQMYRFITYGLHADKKEVAGDNLNTGTLSGKRKGVGLAVEVITSRAGPQLESLDLLECYPDFPRFDHQMSDDDLKVISNRCSESLHTLRLSPSSFITGPALVEFATACTQLRTLHMIGCSSVTDMLLGEIARACPKLEDISVKRCRGFRGDGLHARLTPVHDTLKRLDISQTELAVLNIPTFMRSYSVLEELDASWCFEVSLRGPKLKAEDFKCRTLVKLNLRNIEVNERVLRRVVSESPQLRELHLSSNLRERRQLGVKKLFSFRWPPLEYLTLARGRLTDELWQLLFNNLSQSLVRCDVSDNRELTCALVLKGGESWPKLEELNIGETGTTEESLKVLVSLAPKLKSVKLAGCSKISRPVRKNPLSLRESVDSSEAEGSSSM